MKKFRILTLASILAAAGMMTGCDLFGDSESNTTPSITDPNMDNKNLTAGAGSTSMRGIISDDNAGLKLTIAVKQGSVDVSTNFTISYKDIPSDSKDWSIGDPAKGNGTIAAKSTAASGSYTLVYTVTDKDGASTSQSVTFTVGGGSTGTATTEKTGVIYNRFGKNKGAWNLSGDSAVSASNPDNLKELRDALADATSSVFDGSLISPAGATFVKSNSFDYANATKESIKTAFDAGTSSTKIDQPTVGDIYLIKLSSTSYMALKVTAITEGSTTVGDNSGSISFSYRK